MNLVDDLATRFEISIQVAARRIVEGTKQDCALAISFRSSPQAPLSPHHLYCSRSFEQRFRWKATGCSSAVVAQSIRAAQRTQQLEPLVTTDAGGRGATLELDAVSGRRRAVLVLFRAVSAKSRVFRTLASAS